MRVRNLVPSLKQKTFSVLDNGKESDVGPGWFKCDNNMVLPSNGNSVSAVDLHGFVYEYQRGNDTAAIRLGLASAYVKPNHEIWQFGDTRIALVARRKDTGYKVVGRAYLLRPDKTGGYLSSMLSPDGRSRIVDIADDEAVLPIAERHFILDLRELLTMAAWVDYDAETVDGRYYERQQQRCMKPAFGHHGQGSDDS